MSLEFYLCSSKEMAEYKIIFRLKKMLSHLCVGINVNPPHTHIHKLIIIEQINVYINCNYVPDTTIKTVPVSFYCKHNVHNT